MYQRLIVSDIDMDDNYVYAKTTPLGNKVYYDKDGELHRLDGPAIEYANGNKRWYWHGKWHCETGPALDDADYQAYYYHNKRYYPKDNEEWIRMSKLKALW